MCFSIFAYLFPRSIHTPAHYTEFGKWYIGAVLFYRHCANVLIRQRSTIVPVLLHLMQPTDESIEACLPAITSDIFWITFNTATNQNQDKFWQ